MESTSNKTGGISYAQLITATEETKNRLRTLVWYELGNDDGISLPFKVFTPEALSTFNTMLADNWSAVYDDIDTQSPEQGLRLGQQDLLKEMNALKKQIEDYFNFYSEWEDVVKSISAQLDRWITLFSRLKKQAPAISDKRKNTITSIRKNADLLKYLNVETIKYGDFITGIGLACESNQMKQKDLATLAHCIWETTMIQKPGFKLLTKGEKKQGNEMGFTSFKAWYYAYCIELDIESSTYKPNELSEYYNKMAVTAPVKRIFNNLL